MTSFFRLTKPGALWFFIFFKVFLTSDVMIGGTSDESVQVFFREGFWSWSAELYRSV